MQFPRSSSPRTLGYGRLGMTIINGFTARLKPRSFKARAKPGFFRRVPYISLLCEVRAFRHNSNESAVTVTISRFSENWFINASGLRKGKPQGLKCVRGNQAVPPGLDRFVRLFPALKRWATFARPSGADVPAISVH